MTKAIATVPDHRSEPYTDTDGTVRRMAELSAGKRGELSLKLRMTVEGIIRHVQPRDRLSQMSAIYNWFDARFRYVNDPVNVELVKDPERILEEIEKHGVAVGDCDDASTFLHAALRTIGIPSEFTRASFKRGHSYSHVFAMGKDQHGRWIVLDPVAGAKTGEMLGRIKSSAMGLNGYSSAPFGLTLAGLGGLSILLLGKDKETALVHALIGAIGIYLIGSRGILRQG